MAKNEEISLLLDFYGDMLTDKQKDVVSFYYNQDLSLSEIAENEGITRQGVRDSIKRAETQLLEMEERLGLVRTFLRTRDGLEQILRYARYIREHNDRGGRVKEIDEMAKSIEDAAKNLSL